MWITLLRIKLAIGCAIFPICAVAGSKNDNPESVKLNSAFEIRLGWRKLIGFDVNRHKVVALKIPEKFKRLLSDSSSSEFPSEHSKTIDGKEYMLIVVNQDSRPMNRMSYCGAGEEGTLYVLQIQSKTVTPRYSLPVQSCWHNLELDDDIGNRSPYSAIEWTDNPAGFKVTWINRNDDPPVRTYLYEDGTFVDATK